MDFFSRGYSALVGESKAQQQTPEQTIQRLADRVSASTLLEDKRAAILGLKGLTREYKMIVGQEALEGLLSALNEEIEDPNTVKAILETINNLITYEKTDEPKNISQIHAKKITEVDFHIARLLELIGDSDFHVRYNALQQVSMLFSLSGEYLLSKILISPTGVGRLVDLLSDPREIIRNEGVQLLILMTEKNQELQKILAFENAFEKLFFIIVDEGGVGGNIIVQDCLQLLRNLLAYNISNQKYFRETSCIQKLPDILYFDPNDSETDGHIGDGESAWKPQHGRNICDIIEIVRMLVQPGNIDTPTNQKSMQQCGMISPLLQLCLSLDAPVPVRSQALYAVGDIIHGLSENQLLFQRILVTSSQEDFEDDENDQNYKKPLPEPAVLVITRLAVGTCPRGLDEDSYYLVRAAAAHLVRSYLEENPDAHLGIAATFKPPPSDDMTENTESHQSVGSLLISVMCIPLKDIKHSDVIRIWHATSLFSLLLHKNDDCKQLALNVNIDNYIDKQNIKLLDALFYQAIDSSNLLSEQNPDFTHTEGGSQENLLCAQILTTLSVWLFQSPASISALLKNKDSITFLMEIIGKTATKRNVLQGIASFLFGIIYEFNNDPNTPMKANDLHLILHKRIGVDQLLVHLSRLNDSQELHSAYSKEPTEADNAILDLSNVLFDSSFADLFRNHYNQLRSVVRLGPDAIVRSPNLAPGMNGVAFAKSGKAGSDTESISKDTLVGSLSPQVVKKAEYDQLSQSLNQKNKELEEALQQLNELKLSINKNSDEKSGGGKGKKSKDSSKTEVNNLKKELDESKKRNTELEEKIAELTEQAINSDNLILNIRTEFETSQKSWEDERAQLEEKISGVTAHSSELEKQIEEYKKHRMESVDTVNGSDNSLEALKELESKYNTLEKEQDDLLVLLADQDMACKNYRKQLRDLGAEIPASDEDSDEE
ncbi:hypothetical protein BB559_001704 [Furculomyces boomerangus]|uniref:Vesicle tethering protein Uso1/P115-like head domain-containing protein n=1 Tax=Furculomyces boomerangus TaxID=61424 RepID=A0A2T9Z110_9FUNG|nr:hypothetical protein BB559_001704 [Furculomyces boomerangus]